MSGIVLCPNCGGQKTASKPPYIAGDVNSWVSSSIPMYPCPTCDGQGWIRVDSVPQEDFDSIKSVALSSMETAENLMDECAKRADMIKELEATIICFRSAVKGFKAVVGEKDLRIADLETQRDFIGKTRDVREKELLEIINDLTNENKRLEAYHDCVRDVHQAREMEFATVSERYEIDLGLLDEMLKVVNPLIKSGTYANRDEELLTRQMHSLCQTVVRFRRDHNIVG